MNMILIALILLILLLTYHTISFETFEDTGRTEQLSRIITKMKTINTDLDKLNRMKTISPGTYAKVLNVDLPHEIEKNRKYTNYDLFNISQRVQTSKLDEVEANLNKLSVILTASDNDNSIRSVKSHKYGMNLNLIPYANNTYGLPINGECLFYKAEDDSYDTTSLNRKDNNRVCIDNNPEQQFTLNQIKNSNDYMALVGAVHDDTDIIYPFYLISPVTNNKLFLGVEADTSISLKPILNDDTQRWDGFNHYREC